MSLAYIIGNMTVKDEEKWEEYKSKVPSTLIPWGGELVFRGATSKVLGGEHNHKDNVVIKFPDITSLNNWFNSKEYQALIPVRKLAAEMDLVSYEASF